MATVTDPRNPLKSRPATRPVCGGCRWAVQPTDGHPGCLIITSTDGRGQVTTAAYLVYPVRDDGRLVGYRLQKAAGDVYFLAADLSSCDCPDGTYHPERPGGCKHRRALAAALASLAG